MQRYKLKETFIRTSLFIFCPFNFTYLSMRLSAYYDQEKSYPIEFGLRIEAEPTMTFDIVSEANDRSKAIFHHHLCTKETFSIMES